MTLSLYSDAGPKAAPPAVISATISDATFAALKSNPSGAFQAKWSPDSGKPGDKPGPAADPPSFPAIGTTYDHAVAKVFKDGVLVKKIEFDDLRLTSETSTGSGATRTELLVFSYASETITNPPKAPGETPTDEKEPPSPPPTPGSLGPL
jgi:hypothetical protein